MTALELRQVSKLYGEGPSQVRALDSVDRSVGSGALGAVMGPSGSGKTTLLTIAGGPEQRGGCDRWAAGGESVAQ